LLSESDLRIERSLHRHLRERESLSRADSHLRFARTLRPMHSEHGLHVVRHSAVQRDDRPMRGLPLERAVPLHRPALRSVYEYVRPLLELGGLHLSGATDLQREWRLHRQLRAGAY